MYRNLQIIAVYRVLRTAGRPGPGNPSFSNPEAELVFTQPADGLVSSNPITLLKKQGG